MSDCVLLIKYTITYLLQNNESGYIKQIKEGKNMKLAMGCDPAAYRFYKKLLPFILFIICTIILTWIMSKTSFGNKVYLVGTNAKSAKFAGINVKKTTLCCYMISGILSAVAGLVSLSRLNSAKADFGTSYTMQTILVAVLGGINPDGGFGNIPGIAFAVIILQTLSSYLNQFPAISNYYRDMIWGIALLAVLVFNIYISKRRAKKAASK